VFLLQRICDECQPYEEEMKKATEAMTAYNGLGGDGNGVSGVGIVRKATGAGSAAMASAEAITVGAVQVE
jgi:hypothetical protein